jgi:hypothetical protein
MATGISANKLELLQIADAVAREKGIEVEIVLSAMADAIQKAAKARYGQENDIRVDIDPKTGETKLLRVVTVVELVENDDLEISLPIAQRENADAKLGDEIIDELPPVEFGRIATQAAKQVIVQRVREAERVNLKNLKTASARLLMALSSGLNMAMWCSIWAAVKRLCAAIILSRAKCSARATVFVPISKMCAANSAGRKLFCHVQTRLSCQNYLCRKCRKFTMA